tara:strand:- start:229 stop:528 length:300 start_codon:yes stop_codon:yes gene_type:complete
MSEYIPNGIVFGLLDNGIVLAGMYLGVDFEGWIAKRLGKKSNPLLGAVVGATGFNMVSDGVAAAVDSSMQGMTFGIVLGCALIMLLIPVVEKFRKDRVD